MIENFASYFEPQQEYYLEKIEYKRLDSYVDKTDHSLQCTDHISVKAEEESITVTLSRSLRFEPEELFEMTIAFGAIVRFDPEKRDAIDWHSVNFAEELKNNGGFILSNLVSRISLMIGEITSSFGQQPIILPPTIISGV